MVCSQVINAMEKTEQDKLGVRRTGWNFPTPPAFTFHVLLLPYLEDFLPILNYQLLYHCFSDSLHSQISSTSCPHFHFLTSQSLCNSNLSSFCSYLPHHWNCYCQSHQWFPCCQIQWKWIRILILLIIPSSLKHASLLEFITLLCRGAKFGTPKCVSLACRLF